MPCFIGAGSLDVSRPIIYASSGRGLTLSGNGGRTGDEYIGATRNGNALYGGRYALRRNEIVYWSAEDRALCVVPRVRKPRWLSLKTYLSESDWVHEALPSPEGVVLNLSVEPHTSGGAQTDEQRRGGVLRVDLATGKARRIPDARQARTREESEGYAVRTDSTGRIESRHADGRLRDVLIADARGVSDWDYDPATGRLAYLALHPVLGDRAHYVDSERQRRWAKRIGFAAAADLVTLAPGSGDVWVSENSPYPGARGMVALDGETGSLRGWRIKSVFGVGRRPVAELDDEGLTLVRRLTRVPKGS